MINWFSTNVPRQLNGERKIFSTNGAWTTGLNTWKKVTSTPTSHYTHKLIQDGSWNVKAKIIKLVEENIGACLCDLEKAKIYWRGHKMYQP